MALRHDHTHEQALAALSFPTELTPGGVSRRKFLAGMGAAGALATFGGPGILRPQAAHAASLNRLVVFYLGGGNDGFATVMPTGPSVLDQLRPQLLPAKNTLRSIGGGYGLHPALPTLHSRFNSGQVAVVGGVGASASLSHFESINEWMVGVPSTVSATTRTGWIGRWLDTIDSVDETPLRATSVTGQVPLMFVGQTTAGTGVGVEASTLLGSVRRNPVESGMFEMVEAWGALAADGTTGRAHAARVAAHSSDLAMRVGGLYNPPLPTNDVPVAQARLAARLLNDPQYGCQVVFGTIGGFDHHADLLPAQAASLGAVDRTLAALFASLTPAVAATTTVLFFSEFGRRPQANGSKGTDHGTASYSFLVGPKVKGGVYGTHPNAGARDANGNPSVTVRHLDLLGSILGPWLGADANAILGTTTTNLGLFRP